MKKNFLLLFLMALLPLAGRAAGNLTGTIQDNLKGLKFTIIKVYNNVPEGEANTVSVSQNNWNEKADDNTKLVIPATITFSVKGKDFENVDIDKEVTFDVVEIDDNGFANLDELASVTIPASIKKIGESAFADDYALTSVQIATGSKLTEIGNYAFSAWITEKFDLSSATSLTTLPAKLFLSATAEQNPYVKEVVLPASITDISTALAKLPNLEKVNITDTKLASLAVGALEGNTKITALELPATCKTIADGALTSTKVADLTINAYQTDNSQSVGKVYGDVAADKKVLTKLTVKGEFKGTIAANAFNALDNLAEVKFDAVSGTITAGAFTANPKLNKITLGDVKAGANIQAAFASTLVAGADLKIGNIGAATIAASAFTGLKSVEIGDIAATTAIGDGAFAGANLATITVGEITGNIGASFVSTLAAGAEVTIESIGEGANLGANAFKSIKSLTITNGISAGTFAAGSFVYVDANNVTANLGAISGGTFTAGAITGPTTAGKELTLTIGNVSAPLTNNLATGNIKKATVGEISKAVCLDVFGAAKEIVFGDIKEGGSLTAFAAANTTLAKVTFAAIEVATGITADAFNNATMLATVNFSGLLADGAVAASAFKTAGSALAAGTNMVVTYKPADDQLTKPFNQATFGALSDPVKVTLKTTQKFFDNYTEAAGVVTWFYRTTAEFSKAAVTKTIKFEGEVAPDGYKYARFYVAKDEKAVFNKVDGVTAYSIYVDGEDIYMNPLRVYGGKYQINGVSAIRAAIVVKSKSGEDITVTMNPDEAPTKQSIQNADDKFGILYNDMATALTGAKITMENTAFFKLTDGTTSVNWATLQTDANYANNNAIVLLSNPAKSNYIQFADFDPETQPTVKIAAGGYYLLTKKAATGSRQVVWLDEDGNTTAIESVKVATEEAGEMNDATNNATYNLNGMRVNNTNQKGVYIKNGKKFIVK